MPRCLGKGQNAVVEIQTQRPVALELYKDYKELGRFMLRYVGSTIAAGVVTEVTSLLTFILGSLLVILGHWKE